MKLTHLLSSGLYRWFRSHTGSATKVVRGLYRQWGIAPRPEDVVFSCLISLYRKNEKMQE